MCPLVSTCPSWLWLTRVNNSFDFNRYLHAGSMCDVGLDFSSVNVYLLLEMSFSADFCGFLLNRGKLMKVTRSSSLASLP